MTSTAVVPSMADFFGSLSPQQRAMFAQIVVPQVRSTDAFTGQLEQFADRLSGNGAHADLTHKWATDLEALALDLEDNPHVRAFVSKVLPRLHAAGLTAGEGLMVAQEARTLLAALESGSQGVTIDTTATVVPDVSRETTASTEAVPA